MDKEGKIRNGLLDLGNSASINSEHEMQSKGSSDVPETNRT